MKIVPSFFIFGLILGSLFLSFELKPFLSLQSMAIDWNAINAITNIFILVFAIIGYIIAARSFSHSKNQEIYNRTARVFEKYQEKYSDKLKKIVSQHKKDKLNPEYGLEIGEVSDFFEYVGYLNSRGLIDENSVIEQFSHVLPSFYKASKKITATETGRYPNVYSNFVKLYEKIELENISNRSRKTD